MAKKPERVLGTGAAGDLDEPGKMHEQPRRATPQTADESDVQLTDLDIRQAEAEAQAKKEEKAK